MNSNQWLWPPRKFGTLQQKVEQEKEKGKHFRLLNQIKTLSNFISGGEGGRGGERGGGRDVIVLDLWFGCDLTIRPTSGEKKHTAEPILDSPFFMF